MYYVLHMLCILCMVYVCGISYEAMCIVYKGVNILCMVWSIAVSVCIVYNVVYCICA